VEKVNPDVVARDEQGKPYTVRYEAVNAMLLNEFLKEHRKVERQGATITQLEEADTKLDATVAQQQSTNAEQQKEIEALNSAIVLLADNENELFRSPPRRPESETRPWPIPTSTIGDDFDSLPSFQR